MAISTIVSHRNSHHTLSSLVSSSLSVTIMSRRLRTSKYKHTRGAEYKREQWYADIQVRIVFVFAAFNFFLVARDELGWLPPPHPHWRYWWQMCWIGLHVDRGRCAN